MAIKGLTDKASLDRRVLGRREIKVYKGDRKIEVPGDSKKTRAGKDLGDKFRIVTQDARLRKILAAAYGKPDKNGDILTDAINIVFPFDEPDRTFVTAMKAYSKSGLDAVCDRATISQEVQLIKDAEGNIFREMTACDKPCPVADKPLGFKCPRKCNQEGILYFYIRELFDRDMMIPVEMSVHGYTDISYIARRLGDLINELESITDSRFPCHVYRHKIPFVLTRTQVSIKRPLLDKEQGYIRTGLKTNGSTGAVSIQPLPEYMDLRRAWHLANELKRMSVAIPPQAIAGLLNGNAEAVNYIDVEVVPTEVQKEDKAPLLMPSTINNEERRGLFKVFVDQQGWELSVIKFLLNEKYGYTATSEILVTQIDELIDIARDDKEKKHWHSEHAKQLMEF